MGHLLLAADMLLNYAHATAAADIHHDMVVIIYKRSAFDPACALNIYVICNPYMGGKHLSGAQRSCVCVCVDMRVGFSGRNCNYCILIALLVIALHAFLHFVRHIDESWPSLCILFIIRYPNQSENSACSQSALPIIRCL